MEERSLLLWHGPELPWGEMRRALHELSSLRIIGDTADAELARTIAIEGQPDAIIAPTHLNGESLLPTLAALHRNAIPRSKFILFTASCTPEDLIGPVETWLAGYLEWPALTSEILSHCLTALIWGDIVLGTSGAIRAFAIAQRGTTADSTGPLSLGDKDWAILDGLRDGLTNAALATQLGCNVSTVKRHIAALEVTLGAHDRFTLALQAMRHGLLR
jgi:two-component system, NarL family, nitrate/nitrite response regulator NarL